MTSVTLEQIKPLSKKLVFDLVEQAGYDVRDWINSSSSSTRYKANPKYCYEWAFVQPDSVVILNLWIDQMSEENGKIVQRNNFRQDAEHHQRHGGRATWFKRASRLDEALQTALRDNLTVRVIINYGDMRRNDAPEGERSHVTARELDAEPWTIAEYDWRTGDHAITGCGSSRFCRSIRCPK